MQAALVAHFETRENLKVQMKVPCLREMIFWAIIFLMMENLSIIKKYRQAVCQTLLHHILLFLKEEIILIEDWHKSLKFQTEFYCSIFIYWKKDKSF